MRAKHPLYHLSFAPKQTNMRERDLNPRPSDYEPDERTTALSRNKNKHIKTTEKEIKINKYGRRDLNPQDYSLASKASVSTNFTTSAWPFSILI